MPSSFLRPPILCLVLLLCSLSLFLKGCGGSPSEPTEALIDTEIETIAVPPPSDDQPEQALPPVEEEIIFEEPYLPLVVAPHRTKKIVGPPARTEGRRPKIAIIIDDMGYHQQIGDQLLELPLDMTFSFLPYAPFTSQQEEKAYQLGRDILVHLPMEAKDPSWDPGPGTLHPQESDVELAAATEKLLDQVPHATGTNNHMGSKFTEDANAMQQVLATVKRKGFFYIDSYTSPASVGQIEAEKLGIPSARRHVFLDNVHDPEKICRQLEQLVTLSGKQGWAIGIGHPNQATLTALTQCTALLQDVDVVGVHHLLQEGNQ